MGIHLLLKGAMMGLVVAVPVGSLGLLCINRALSMGPWYRFGVLVGCVISRPHIFRGQIQPATLMVDPSDLRYRHCGFWRGSIAEHFTAESDVGNTLIKGLA